MDTLLNRLAEDLNNKENVIAIAEEMCTIADNDEERVVKFLNKKEIVTLYITVLFDISSLHPELSHSY